MSPRFFRLTAGSHIVAALVMLFVLVPPASAHTELISTDPAAGAELSATPHEVTLTFTDQMSGEFNTLSLIVADSEPLPLEAVTEGNVVRADVPSKELTVMDIDGPAEWSLVYRVVSADGHPVSGEVTFQAPLPSPEPDTSEATASGTTPASESDVSEPSGSVTTSTSPPGRTAEAEAAEGVDIKSSADQSGGAWPVMVFVPIAVIILVGIIVVIALLARRRSGDRASDV